MEQSNVKPANGKLGILVVGNGAVATTFMTGVLMARKGLAKPIGAMTQYDKVRIGKGNEKKYLKYSDIVPLAKLDDIVFGCWDVYPQNAYQSAVYAEVLKRSDIDPVLRIGGSGIHIPFHLSWAFEEAEEYDHPRLAKVVTFREILHYL